MSDVQQIESAVRQLSPEALAEFRRWFAEFDAALWDKQIEQDAQGGRLEKLGKEAIDDLKNGRCSNL